MSYFVRTHKKRKIFLDHLSDGSSVTRAAQAAGGTTQNFKAWRKQDANFAADWDEAIEQGTDLLEDVATHRAIKKSDQLLIHLLKARRPDKHNPSNKLEAKLDVSVENSKQTLLNKIARLQASDLLSLSSDTKKLEISKEEKEEDLNPA